eukprot:1183534-Prorocentrum_minimum.AAC.4
MPPVSTRHGRALHPDLPFRAFRHHLTKGVTPTVTALWLLGNNPLGTYLGRWLAFARSGNARCSCTQGKGRCARLPITDYY